MTRILLTGFAPFGGDASNPSEDVVRAVGTAWAPAHELHAEVLPVSFAEAATRMRALVAEHSPDVVLATGLAGGRTAIGVERVAINLMDARIPDNDGDQPIDVPSVPGAPAAGFATVPVKRIVRALVSMGVPAEVSHSAGTYVCNHVFFTALQSAPSPARVGFLHLPWPRDDDRPHAGPTLSRLIDAVALALREILADDGGGPADAVRDCGGSLH